MWRLILAALLIAQPVAAGEILTVERMRYGCEVATHAFSGIVNTAETPEESAMTTYCGAYFSAAGDLWCAAPFDAKEALTRFNDFVSSGAFDSAAFNQTVYDFLIEAYACPAQPPA